ncbi:MAG TPA: hypothetical protein VGO18_33570 [Steroidobacteraceae bacterium]|nr:hypothetical protein [Steroidobacteraceae bacterium]
MHGPECEVGLVSPDQLKACGGLEFWEKTLRGAVPAPPTYACTGEGDSGKSTAIAEGRIEDPDGKLYALCTTTCLLFPTA